MTKVRGEKTIYVKIFRIDGEEEDAKEKLSLVETAIKDVTFDQLDDFEQLVKNLLYGIVHEDEMGFLVNGNC